MNVWTEGTAIAARNAAQCRALLDGKPCAMHRGDDWAKEKTRCPFCDRDRGDYSFTPFADGPNTPSVPEVQS